MMSVGMMCCCKYVAVKSFSAVMLLSQFAVFVVAFVSLTSTSLLAVPFSFLKQINGRIF